MMVDFLFSVLFSNVLSVFVSTSNIPGNIKFFVFKRNKEKILLKFTNRLSIFF